MNKVYVINPDGKRGKIPESELNEALKYGYKLAGTVEKVAVTNPQGQKGKIPKYELTEALKHGYNLVSHEDSWPSFIGKSALKVASSVADIPKMVASGLDSYVNSRSEYDPHLQYLKTAYPEDPVIETPSINSSSYIPDSADARNAIKKYTNIDLEPRGDSAGKRIAGGVIEGAGAMLGGGVLGLGAKAAGALKTAKFLGAPNNLHQARNLGLMGGALGGTGSALVEEGVDPLTANLAPAIIAPIGFGSGKNLFNKFRKSHRDDVARYKVASVLKNQIGEEELPTVLNSVDQYLNKRKPFGMEFTTPDIAQNVALSRLQQAKLDTNNILPEVYKKQNERMLSELENIGLTGLPESVKGEQIRTNFFDRFNKNKDRRERITRPLYDELSSIKEGINPAKTRELLTNEIEVASIGTKPKLEKYLAGLNRNKVDQRNADRVKEINNTLSDYSGMSENALAQLKKPLEEELKQYLYPRPIQIENTIQELGDTINAYSRTGKTAAARKYGQIKNTLTEDLAQNPAGLRHREEYRRLSKPIGEIEKSPLLNNFIKKNKDVSKRDGFVVPSEKIPSLIMDADLTSTKELINKAKGNKETLDLIKGTYIDNLIKSSTLSNQNISFDKANKFLNNKYNKEKIKEIFNKKEQRKLNLFLDVLEKRNKAATMGKMVGSDTKQKIQIQKDFEDSLNGLGKITSKGIEKLSSSNGLLNKLWNTAGGYVREGNINRYNSVLEDALLNPLEFEKLMLNTKAPKQFKDYYNPGPSLLTGAILGNRKN